MLTSLGTSLIAALIAALFAFYLVERKERKLLDNYYKLYIYELESIRENYGKWLNDLFDELRDPQTKVTTIPIDVHINYLSELKVHLINKLNVEHRKLLRQLYGSQLSLKNNYDVRKMEQLHYKSLSKDLTSSLIKFVVNDIYKITQSLSTPEKYKFESKHTDEEMIRIACSISKVEISHEELYELLQLIKGNSS